MNTNNVAWLMDWYNDKCDGIWEHLFGIKIDSVDNPGWSITIDLDDTYFSELPWKYYETNDNDWYGYKIENRKFVASGDPLKLDLLIGIFKSLILKQD